MFVPQYGAVGAHDAAVCDSQLGLVGEESTLFLVEVLLSADGRSSAALDLDKKNLVSAFDAREARMGFLTIASIASISLNRLSAYADKAITLYTVCRRLSMNAPGDSSSASGDS